MYKPRLLVTKKAYDLAPPIEREKYNYVVVADKPLPVPDHICSLNQGSENAEKRTEPTAPR